MNASRSARLSPLASPNGEVADAEGLEPSIYGFEGRCSIQLCYTPINLTSMARFGLTPYYASRKPPVGIEPTII